MNLSKNCIRSFLLLALGLLATSVALRAETVTISDTNLAKKVRTTLGLPENAEITYAKLQELYSLDISSSLVEDINGLENAKNLRYLNAANNGISDISKLSELTELRFLDLSQNNRITEGSHLQTLVKLNTLALSGTKIGNLNFLEPIADAQAQSNGEYALERLYFVKFFVDRTNHGVEEISVLSKFPRLNTVYADNNRIESLAPLVPLMNETKVLKHLSVSGNYLNNLSEIIPAAGNTSSLQTLYFSRCFLRTISGLETAKFPNLKEVDLSNNYLDATDNSTDRNVIAKFAEISGNNVVFLPQRANIWVEGESITAYENGTMYRLPSFFPSDDYQFIFKSTANWIYSFTYGFIYFPDAPQVNYRYFAYFGYSYDEYETETDPYKNMRTWVSIDFINLPYGNGTIITFTQDGIEESFGPIPKLIGK